MRTIPTLRMLGESITKDIMSRDTMSMAKPAYTVEKYMDAGSILYVYG